jgi:hypothetical protein
MSLLCRCQLCLRLFAGLGAVALGLRSTSQTTWQRTYGGYGTDQAHAVCSSPTGGAVVVGSTGSFGDQGDAYIIHIDHEGELIWSRVIGGSGAQVAWDIVSAEGAYFVAGMSQAAAVGDFDGWIARIEEDGTVSWQRTIGTPEWDWFHSLGVEDGGLHLAGVTYQNGEADAWLVKADLQGGEIWQSVVGTPGDDEAHAVLVAPNGDLVVVGTAAVGDDSDAFVARFLPDGQLEWHALIGTDSLDAGFGACSTQDGGVALVGYTHGFRPHSQLMIAKVSVDGEEEWLQHWGEGGDFLSHAIIERLDGGFALAGVTSAFGAGGKDFFLLKADSDGGYDFGATFGGGGDDEAHDIDLTVDNGFIMVGSAQSFGPGPRSVFVVRTDSDADTESDVVTEFFDPVGEQVNPAYVGVSVFPNPTRAGERLTIRSSRVALLEYSLADMSGRILTHVDAPVAYYAEVSVPRGMQGMYILSAVFADGARLSFPLVVVSP